MVFRKEAIISRLKELDTVTEELLIYKNVSLEDLKRNLSTRWIIERTRTYHPHLPLVKCAHPHNNIWHQVLYLEGR